MVNLVYLKQSNLHFEWLGVDVALGASWIE